MYRKLILTVHRTKFSLVTRLKYCFVLKSYMNSRPNWMYLYIKHIIKRKNSLNIFYFQLMNDMVKKNFKTDSNSSWIILWVTLITKLINVANWIMGIEREIVTTLHTLFDRHNELIWLFRIVLERMPEDDYKIVVRTKKSLIDQQVRQYNASTIDEVAIVI